MITYQNLSKAGRLGNQLWQIASTAGIAAANNDEPQFPDWDYEPFFNVPHQWFKRFHGGREATEFVPHMDERAKPYLQDFNLWSHIQDDIMDWFCPSPRAGEILDGIWDAYFSDLPMPLVSVHVRRGDNVTHPKGYHPLRSMDYYKRALEMREGTVVVFTDDPAWVKENFAKEVGREVAHVYEGTPRPREYVDRVKYEDAPVLDWIDLQLMARIESSHVLSNSTYAWWGAFLSGDPQPIFPGSWFGKLVNTYTDSALMFPDHWLEVYDDTMGGV